MSAPASHGAPARASAAPLAVTQGDPSGIGPEIAIKAWLARDAHTPPWFLLADPQHIARTAAALGLSAPVAQLQAEGIDAFGPLPPDTMFHAAARARYDVAICMYHDQGLIPAKTLAFDSGVNTTLGLPFIRTSPDHGTAFDIAGKGVANESSLIAAIALAARLVASATQ